jgi:hypothetical protein
MILMHDRAYFGNQQFTTSQLVFVNCHTALQVHWDWAWTMQDYVIESCHNGLTIGGGVGLYISNLALSIVLIFYEIGWWSNE